MSIVNRLRRISLRLKDIGQEQSVSSKILQLKEGLRVDCLNKQATWRFNLQGPALKRM